MTSHCDWCTQPVITTATGRVLGPHAARLGLYDPSSGELLSHSQLNERLRRTGLAGHADHRCPPQPQLFQVTP